MITQPYSEREEIIGLGELNDSVNLYLFSEISYASNTRRLSNGLSIDEFCRSEHAVLLNQVLFVLSTFKRMIWNQKKGLSRELKQSKLSAMVFSIRQ